MSQNETPAEDRPHRSQFESYHQKLLADVMLMLDYTRERGIRLDDTLINEVRVLMDRLDGETGPSVADQLAQSARDFAPAPTVTPQ